jgi:hypothetical protein
MKINEIITEGEVIPLGKKHRGDLAGTHSCVSAAEIYKVAHTWATK